MDNGNETDKNSTKNTAQAAGTEPPKSSGSLNDAIHRRSAFDDLLSYSPRFEAPKKPPVKNNDKDRDKDTDKDKDKDRTPSPHKKNPSAQKNGSAKPVYYGSDGANGSKPVPKRKRKKKKALHTFPPAQNKKAADGKSKNKVVTRARNIAGLKRTLVIFILLLFIAAGIYGLYRLTTVDEITVSGSEKYDGSFILDHCGIQTGHNIFAYRFAYIEEKLNTIPELKLISIKRILPSKIELNVADRFPRAALPSGNGTYTVIDSEGFVISIGERNTEGLILINGLASESFKPGNYINREENLSLRSVAATEFLKAIDESSMQSLVIGIDISNISCVKLLLKNDFTAVLGAYPEALGNTGTAEKAYNILLERYPKGGIINVFSNKTTVDFTPNA